MTGLRWSDMIVHMLCVCAQGIDLGAHNGNNTAARARRVRTYTWR